MTPDRRLPGRRPPRGHLRDRAGHGRPRRRTSASTRPSCGAATSSRRSSSPTTAVTGLAYDSGDHERGAGPGARSSSTTTRCGPSRRERRAAGGTKHLGIGISSYFEMCGLAPSRVLASLNYSAGGWESATVRILPTSKVQVVTGATPHGQGHETSWAMIVADQLGVDPDDVDVLHSDTALSPLGHGHLRVPLARRRRDRHHDGVRPGARQGPLASPPTSSRRPRTTSSIGGGAFSRAGLARQVDAARRGRVRGVHRPRPARRRWSRTSRPRSPTTRRTSRGRSARTSAWSRSTRRPAASTSASTSRSTTAATRSTR